MEKETTADIDAIRGYATKNANEIISSSLNSLSIFKDLTVDRRLLTDKNLNKMTTEKGVRPLNTGIKKEKGKRKFKKRVITPRFGMKIINVIPEDLRETFLSAMLDPNAKREPLAKWMWDREFEMIANEVETNFYNAEYNDSPDEWDAAATYAPGALVYFDDIVHRAVSATSAAESPTTHAAKWEDVDNAVLFDGPGTIISKEVLAGDLAPIVSGVFDDSNAYDAFITQWNALPEVEKNKRPTAFVSFDTAQDLASNVNDKFGSGKGISNADIEEGRPFILKNTGGRLTIKPCIWMGASRRIIMTHKSNMIVGTNQVADFNKIGKLVEHLHGYHSIIKFMLTFQYRDIEEGFYINDQE